MVYYELVNMTIDTLAPVKVIIKIAMWHYGLLDLIINNWNSVFISKFWSLLCYFLRIKRKLLTAFYPQINDETKRQNSNIEAYLQVFLNFKQDDLAMFLPIAKFAYQIQKISVQIICFSS